MSVQEVPASHAPPHIVLVPQLAAAAPLPVVRHILVVDDATVIRLYYRRILEAQGFVVAEAINGMEGIERALQAPFDLCVVDVNMPIMDGYLFVRTVRREPAIHAMPVLMTSTQASPADHLLARQAGANFYLVKPVGQARLASVAAVLLGLPDPALQEPARPDPERPEPKLSGPKLSEPKLAEPKLSEPKLSEPKLSEQGRITA